MFNNVTTIALYDTLGLQAARYILGQTELTTICCSIDIVEKLLTMKDSDKGLPESDQSVGSLQNIVSFEKVLDQDLIEQVEERGLKLYSFDEVLFAGIDLNENEQKFVPVKPAADDVFMLSYTSGTTGDPKGVQLTHKNMMVETGNVYLRYQFGP
jgi:long-chain acyl-CoA synthetase